MHKQALAAALPSGDTEFAGQFLHADCWVLPVASRYVFAPQSVQMAVSLTPALYLPASQTRQSPLASLA